MPDNSDVQSRYMQAAESHAQKKRTRISERQDQKIFRQKRNTIGNTADAVNYKKTPVVPMIDSQSILTERERAEEHLRLWMNATRRNENFAEYGECINTTSNAASCSSHVNLQWITKLRSNKNYRRKNNSNL
jgi:hypothetical protein